MDERRKTTRWVLEFWQGGAVCLCCVRAPTVHQAKKDLKAWLEKWLADKEVPDQLRSRGRLDRRRNQSLTQAATYQKRRVIILGWECIPQAKRKGHYHWKMTTPS